MNHYMSRSAAIRAARQACRVALDSPIYEAHEGPDFEIHPTTDPSAVGEMTKAGRVDFGKRWYFRLRGPALDAQNRADSTAVMAAEPDNGDRFW